MEQRLVKPYSQKDLDELTLKEIERGCLKSRLEANDRLLVLEIEGEKTKWAFSLESNDINPFGFYKITTPIKEPTLPIKLYDKLWHQGWESPTLFAIDAENRCWMNGAHGGAMDERSCDYLIEIAETEHDRNKIKRTIGKPEKVICPHCHGAGWIDGK
jgi:hypothetical protein